MSSVRGVLCLVVFAYRVFRYFRKHTYSYLLILALLMAHLSIHHFFPEILTLLHVSLALGVSILYCSPFGALSTPERRMVLIFGYCTSFALAYWLSRVGDPGGITTHGSIGGITSMWSLLLIGVAAVQTSRDNQRLHLILRPTPALNPFSLRFPPGDVPPSNHDKPGYAFGFSFLEPSPGNCLLPDVNNILTCPFGAISGPVQFANPDEEASLC